LLERRNEKHTDYLKQEIEGIGKDYVNSPKMVYSSLLMHFLLFMSFDNISKKNGYLLLTDGIHQNSLGAMLIAEEIEEFIGVFK
jgi:lysophospholipase L1-like esterase